MRTAPDAIDPVIAASALSFGFVFIHPFMDGNGRLHRYLIHESLSVAGFTPKGIILPVSTVIVANLDRYKSALEVFSRPLRDQALCQQAQVPLPMDERRRNCALRTNRRAELRSEFRKRGRSVARLMRHSGAPWPGNVSSSGRNQCA